jgi:hypothetical protein
MGVFVLGVNGIPSSQFASVPLFDYLNGGASGKSTNLLAGGFTGCAKISGKQSLSAMMMVLRVT